MPKKTPAYLLIFVLASAAFTIHRIQSPPLTPEQYGIDFQSIKKELHLLSAESRSPGTDGHKKTQDYLVQKLNRLNCKAEIQDALGSTVVAQHFNQVGYAENVLCRLKGENSSGAVLFLSHYDSVNNSPGAADNMSGVVTSLNVLKKLSQQKPQNDFIFLFSDLEESGLIGASAFAEQHPWMKDVRLVVNFEARGSKGPSAMFESSANSAALIEVLSEAMPAPISSSFTNPILKVLPNDTELSVFKMKNIRGINFAFADGLQHYHSQADSAENLSERSLFHHNINALAVASALANIDLNQLESTSDYIYFDFWRLKLLYFPFWSALLLLILSFALFNFLRSHYQISLKESLFSSFLYFLKVFIFATSIYLFSFIIRAFVPVNLIFENNKTLFLAYLCLFAPLLTKEYFLKSKKPLQRISAYFAMLILASIFYYFAPQLSYFIIFPLFFVLSFEVLLSRKILNNFFLFICGSVFFFPCAVIVPYITYSVLIADGGLTPSAPFIFSTVFIGLTPLLWQTTNALQRNLLRASLFCLSFFLFAYVIFTSDFSKQNPRAHTLNYAYQANAQSYQWLHWGDSPDQDPWLKQFFSKNIIPIENYSFYTPYTGLNPTQSPAPKLPHLKGPKLSLLSKKDSQNSTEWRFRYHSVNRAPCARLWIKNGVNVHKTQINDQDPLQMIKLSPQIDQKIFSAKLGLNDQITWQLRFCGGHRKDLLFSLVTDKEKKLLIQVVESTPGLPKFPNYNYQRPSSPKLIPHQHSDISIVSKFFNFQ